MKTRLATLAAIGLVVSLAAPLARAQNETQQPSTFEGQLLEIDPAMQLIVVGHPGEANEPPMVFNYSSDTEVVGSIEDVQGLGGNTGAEVRVTYHVQGDANIATTIEVVSLPEQEP